MPEALSMTPSPHGGVPRTYILDTNVLIADADAPRNFHEHDVVVPLTVVEELDGLKNRMDETGVSARRALRFLESLRGRGGIATGVPLEGGGIFRVELNHVAGGILPTGLSFAQADNRILAVTANLAKEYGEGRRVILVTKDVSLRIKAEALGVQAEEYRHEHVTLRDGYTGAATMDVEAPLDELYTNRIAELTATEPLAANQFLILRSGSQSALGQVRRTVTPGEQVDVHLLPDPSEVFGIRARSKEQQFALHLLRDPEVPLVSLAGNAGTGKTFLALAAGLESTLEDHTYDRVLVFRPVVPVGRQELGFLPGDVEEKMSPWMKAVHDVMGQLFRGSGDNRESYTADLVQGLMDDGTVEMEPLTFIRGRTLARTFAVLDEAQNVEYGVLRSLASRLGEGSKLVLCHDTSQVDHPYVDPDSGVAALVERLRGEPLFGHVTLIKGERSPLAELAARRL